MANAMNNSWNDEDSDILDAVDADRGILEVMNDPSTWQSPPREYPTSPIPTHPSQTFTYSQHASDDDASDDDATDEHASDTHATAMEPMEIDSDDDDDSYSMIVEESDTDTDEQDGAGADDDEISDEALLEVPDPDEIVEVPRNAGFNRKSESTRLSWECCFQSDLCILIPIDNSYSLSLLAILFNRSHVS